MLYASASVGANLTSENYNLEINTLCAEGNVTCEKIEIIFAGTSETFSGKTLHSKCTDQATPCKFQGYEFSTDKNKYLLTAEGSILIFSLSGELLAQEQGQWKH